MGKNSAGILAWHKEQGILKVLLIHPGGPFFTRKDIGVWSIPKGEPGDNEDMLDAARREFFEELGIEVSGTFIPLQPVKQKGGKVVHAWAVEAWPDISRVHSNTFAMEWPPRSGKMQEFPEVDKAEWFTVEEAKTKINSAQVGLIDELAVKVHSE
jgi:predicted NUDIX family NTP pyrophosphohydrolase